MSGDLWSAVEDGRLANLDAIVSTRESILTGGPANGMRAVDVRVWGGIDLRILPDRGFDLGQAWFGGAPLAWVSAVGETGPLSDPQGDAWVGAFGGGLLTTCGLRNVGAASEGHGLHGTYAHLAASGVDVRRFGGEGVAGVVAQATVDDVGALSHHLRLRRTIRTYAGRGRIDITDLTANLGREPEPAPILYHFNFGYPLWSRGARLTLPTVETTARDGTSAASLDTWNRPIPVESSEERVLEHVVEPDDDGLGWARIENERLGVAVTLRWRTAELPRFHQWIHPAPGIYVLGLEPANCSTGGRAHDRAAGRLPMLGPGEVRETSLAVEVETLSGIDER
jgi:hypothetical protein